MASSLPPGSHLCDYVFFSARVSYLDSLQRLTITYIAAEVVYYGAVLGGYSAMLNAVSVLAMRREHERVVEMLCRLRGEGPQSR